MTFSIKGRNFFHDSKKVFLNSGEIHYFRIRRELWDRHLDEAVNAGLTAVSTYIPWAWHEEEESHFDLTAQHARRRTLRDGLRAAASTG